LAQETTSIRRAARKRLRFVTTRTIGAVGHTV